VLLGRRGPAQAAFDQGELEGIADLSGVAVATEGEVSFADEADLPAAARKNLAYLARLRLAGIGAAQRVLKLCFLASPVEILGEQGRVRGVRVQTNRLVGAGPHVRAEPTGELWELAAGLVIRSVGYRGVAIPGLPFDEKRNVIPSSAGRVTSPEGRPLPGLYTSGWIKRGPSGLIGTNKACSRETVELMLRDAELLRGRTPSVDVPALLRERGVRVVTFADYQKIDAFERARGVERGKVRDKLESVAEMLAVAHAPA